MRRIAHGQTRHARAAAIAVAHRAIRELSRVVSGGRERFAAPDLDEAVVAARGHKHIVATDGEDDVIRRKKYRVVIEILFFENMV